MHNFLVYSIILGESVFPWSLTATAQCRCHHLVVVGHAAVRDLEDHYAVQPGQGRGRDQGHQQG